VEENKKHFVTCIKRGLPKQLSYINDCERTNALNTIFHVREACSSLGAWELGLNEKALR